MAVQPPTGPPKPPPDGDQGKYLERILYSNLTDELKIKELQKWIPEKE